jgi:hypothetical protein
LPIQPSRTLPQPDQGFVLASNNTERSPPVEPVQLEPRECTELFNSIVSQSDKITKFKTLRSWLKDGVFSPYIPQSVTNHLLGRIEPPLNNMVNQINSDVDKYENRCKNTSGPGPEAAYRAVKDMRQSLVIQGLDFDFQAWRNSLPDEIFDLPPPPPEPDQQNLLAEAAKGAAQFAGFMLNFLGLPFIGERAY